MTREARIVSTGHVFLEGPRWRDGDLYVSDIFAGEVLRFAAGSADAEVLCRVDGLPSGLGFLPGGDLVIVSMRGGVLLRWDGAQLTTYADLRGLVRGDLNDLLVDDDGTCWVGNFGHSRDDVSDFGPTRLIRVAPSGEVALIGPDLNFPNGIVRLGDELIVAETYASRIRALRVSRDGSVVGDRTWATFGGAVDHFDLPSAHVEAHVEPDGLAVGAEGTLWVGDAKGRGALRVREGGEIVDVVTTGELSAYAVAVGEDRLLLCCAPPNRTTDVAAARSGVLMTAPAGA